MSLHTVDEDRLRRWLTLLRRPDQLAEPEITSLLSTHGRLPENTSAMAVGHAAADFLVAAIERLRPQEDSGRTAAVPYLVLKTCFVQGRKLNHAAGELGMSTRQLTRERSKAIQVLLSELSEGPTSGPAPSTRRTFLPEPIPSIMTFMPRPDQSNALQQALEQHRLVHVHGAPGVGKTSLVADFAHRASEDTAVMWHRFRHGVNDTLVSFLFEIGQHVYEQDGGELLGYLTQALPAPDLTLASRLALHGLASAPRLIVLDDYHVIEDDDTISGLLDEVGARLPNLRIVTISRHRGSDTEAGFSFEVDPLSRPETQNLLERLGVAVDASLADSLHGWTGGMCQLVRLAASWLKTATPDEVSEGIESLRDTAGVRTFLLRNVTELIGPADHAVLTAASVFRTRFTDDALAFVAQRTRGEVQDASTQLVRSYLAARSRRGDVALLQNSVREYVYSRIDTRQRAELHNRAALWYRRQADTDEADYHERGAIEAEEELADLYRVRA